MYIYIDQKRICQDKFSKYEIIFFDFNFRNSQLRKNEIITKFLSSNATRILSWSVNDQPAHFSLPVEEVQGVKLPLDSSKDINKFIQNLGAQMRSNHGATFPVYSSCTLASPIGSSSTSRNPWAAIFNGMAAVNSNRNQKIIKRNTHNRVSYFNV
jgi:hypothetical protein